MNNVLLLVGDSKSCKVVLNLLQISHFGKSFTTLIRNILVWYDGQLSPINHKLASRSSLFIDTDNCIAEIDKQIKQFTGIKILIDIRTGQITDRLLRYCVDNTVHYCSSVTTDNLVATSDLVAISDLVATNRLITADIPSKHTIILSYTLDILIDIFKKLAVKKIAEKVLHRITHIIQKNIKTTTQVTNDKQPQIIELRDKLLNINGLIPIESLIKVLHITDMKVTKHTTAECVTLAIDCYVSKDIVNCILHNSRKPLMYCFMATLSAKDINLDVHDITIPTIPNQLYQPTQPNPIELHLQIINLLTVIEWLIYEPSSKVLGILPLDTIPYEDIIKNIKKWPITMELKIK